MATDCELFERWCDGDANSGNELFERHFDPLYRFFRGKVMGDAEDLVQQTFLACLRAKDGFRHDASFWTYLFTAARSKLYDHLRKRKAQQDIDFGVTSLVDLGVSPSGKLAQREEQRATLAALRSLPLDLQIALELHYLEGLTGPALAAVLEVPEGTVRSRLHRAREQVASKLAELGGQIPGADHEVERWATALRATAAG